MGMLDHWQPVARSRDLGRKPEPVVIAGNQIAIFRTESGQLGAVADACPHRRLKLSAGKVIGEHLQCRYHGWTFDACGQGESPGAPKMTTCTTSYDIREEYGLVWVKTRDSNPRFPTLDTEGFIHIGTLVHDAPAPLELTMDNFNEIEHSGTVHANFGYDLDQMHEVKVNFESTDDSLRVINVGPTKRLPILDRFFVGIRKGDLFHDDWTTWFSPLHSQFDHWWTSADGKEERKVRWRVFLFYVPVTETKTRVFSMLYAKSRWPIPGGGLRSIRWYIRRQTRQEIDADIDMLQYLADYEPGLAGLKLSRFDKSLGLTRERIQRVYKGEQQRPTLRALL
ncbi:MAG: Rieske 2Fe-2S domain-containing protein [Planctomycetes bacterium]|nr:Rieske 2Fe-2S domain-containing protein [Planctomycetota bacterium]